MRGAIVLACLLLAAGCGGEQEGGRLVENPIQPEPAASIPPEGTPAKTPDPEDVFDDPIEGVRTVFFPASDDVRLTGKLFGDDQNRPRGVVLVHRDDATMGTWFPLALDLMDRGYAALAFNLRGHGQSEGRASEDDYPDDVVAALEILYLNGVDEAVVIGVEAGGTAAIGAASSWAGPVKGVITIDAEPAFGALDVSAEAKDLDVPALVIGKGTSSDLAELIPDATYQRNSQRRDHVKDGALAEAIGDFLEQLLG